LQVDEIARIDRLETLTFGPGDLSASLGMGQLTIGTLESGYPGDVWHYALMRLLVAARANDLLAVDGPYAAFHDLDGLEASARRTAALGFDGKWVIHPTRSRRSIASSRPTRRWWRAQDPGRSRGDRRRRPRGGA
jgi:citrate lyase subunit beta/citryl-CoA lyase